MNPEPELEIPPRRTGWHPATWWHWLAVRLPARHRHRYQPVAVYHQAVPFTAGHTVVVLLCSYGPGLACGRPDQYAWVTLPGCYELDEITVPLHGLASVAAHRAAEVTPFPEAVTR